jgi:RimJ/RimL family protein N-acetyltransferase
VALYNKTIKLNGLDVVIRNPEEKDAAQLVDLIKLVDAESNFLAREPGEFKTSVNREKELISSWIKSPYKLYLVADINGEIAAVCNVTIDSRRRYCHKGEIGLAVKKEFWNKSIGRTLLEECINWSKENNLQKLYFDTDTENVKIHALAKKLGFNIEGTKIKDRKLGDGTFRDSYLMALII